MTSHAESSKIASPLENARQRQFGRNLMVEEYLNRVREEDVKRMPERVFNGVFMPIFCSELLHYNQTLEHWVNFAGNPYMPVDVVDSSNVVLFRVPPLLNRDMINPKTGMTPTSTIGHLITTYHQISMQSPMQGQHYLNRELEKRALFMKVPGDFLKELEVWNKIFTRYGRKPILELTAAQQGMLNTKNGDDAGVPDFQMDVD